MDDLLCENLLGIDFNYECSHCETYFSYDPPDRADQRKIYFYDRITKRGPNTDTVTHVLVEVEIPPGIHLCDVCREDLRRPDIREVIQSDVGLSVIYRPWGPRSANHPSITGGK